jgi:transketolase N-terminal domain/subunit
VLFLVISSPSAVTAARAAHDRLANAIRALAMDAVEAAKLGHPGLPMGAADVATVLFTRFLLPSTAMCRGSRPPPGRSAKA